MANEQAGYFIHDWQELRDRVTAARHDIAFTAAHRHLPSSAFPRMGSFVQSRRFRFFNIDENA